MTTVGADAATALAARLRTVLAGPLGARVRIEDLRRLTGGASRTTWAFTAHTEAGSRALILRTGPPDDVHAGMELEARVQELAAAQGAPVPEVLAASNSTVALGNPYLICAEIGGETIVRRILRGLDGAGRARLLMQCAAALAAIHRADPADAELVTEDPLTRWRNELDTMGDTTATLEWAFRWLEANRPAGSAITLVHGDFRMGNLIVDLDSGPDLAAVLDWELVHGGQPAEDLAWFCIRAWRFGAPKTLGAGGLGSVEDFLSAYEAFGGAAIDRTAFHWWLVLATLRWGVICRYQAERHLSGETSSVELATIGRRVCETEWDLLNLLEDGAPAAAFLLGDSVAASSPGVTDWYGRPTAAELVDAVAEFLDGAVRDATGGQVQFHARVAANALRMVTRELTATDVDRVTAALGRLGAADEATLAAAIRRGDLDGRTDEVLPTLRALVGHRLAAAHPGYEDDR
jgi:aminoglycoside phosphotransferase (APT) family kinase protein